MEEARGRAVYTTAILSGPIVAMLGLQWSDVMAAAGLASRSKDDNGFLVDATEFMRLWSEMMRMAPMPHMSRILGERTASGPAIPVLFAMSTAPDLATGMYRLARYKHLFGPMRFAIQKSDERCDISIVSDSPEFDLPPTFSSPQIVYLHSKANALATRRLIPTRVRLPLPQSEREAMFDLFSRVPDAGAPMISYQIADTRIPFISDNPSLWAATERDLDSMSSIVAKDIALTERVRAGLLEAFAVTNPTQTHICARLRMSRTSLIRGLARENTTFQEVLDKTRSTLAVRYLKDSDLTNQQIAHLVGYRDTSAFQRAFRKWTGQTPRDLRHGRR